MVNWEQILFNGLLTGSFYFLLTIGLTMTYKLLNFPNVAHAEFITFGAYIGYTISERLQLGFVGGIIASFLLTGLVGVLSYLIIFRTLAKRGGGSMDLCVASIGFGLAFRFIIQQIWGREVLLFEHRFLGFSLGAIRVTWLWILTIFVAVIFFISFHLILTKTKLGKAMRATSNNPVLARACGINTEKIIVLVWFIGSALAGIGGMLKACDTRITPELGWNLIIIVFAVAIFGGIGSFYGAIIASYIIGLVENLSLIPLATFMLSTEYKVIVAFMLLVIILIFKPRGLVELKFLILKRSRKHG